MKISRKTSETASNLHQGKLSQSLAGWYHSAKRRLPWRETNDPYAIWLSEIMLQQTTVRVVIPYYEKFLREFPTVRDLALARQEKVLSLWSGLGYYSRARNLHKAARLIDEAGRFPTTYEEIIKLPGIGPYTAAAIASIAFSEEKAVVDGNVIRVITRLFDIREDVGSQAGKKRVSRLASQLISGQNPSSHNQSVMELGATLCTPANPSCLLCPVSTFCKSLKVGTILERPIKRKNRLRERWLWTMNLSFRKGRIALIKNENGTPWLKNTWVLPGEAARWLSPKPPKADFKHSITHHNIFVKTRKAGFKNIPNSKIRWINPENMDKLGVSSVVHKALKHAKVIKL